MVTSKNELAVFFKIVLCMCFIKQEGESCYRKIHDPDMTNTCTKGLTFESVPT
jgi:hypothetical protein